MDIHTPALSFVGKVLGIIGSFIVIVMIMATTFVLASDYKKDRLADKAMFISWQLSDEADRLEKAHEKGDSARIKQIEDQISQLRKLQLQITHKQLDN